MGRKEGCRSLWRMALLAASIFSSCFLLIEGQAPVTQIQIQVQPERPIEGHDVTLTPKGNLSGARSCRWFRGQTFDPKNQILMYYFPPNPEELPGPAFTNRETIGPGCSLQIRNLTSGDTRNYTVNVEGTGINAVGNASVIVTGPNGDDPGLSSGVIAGIVIGCLVGVVLVSGLLYYICAKTSLGRMEQHASNGNIPSAPGHNEGVTDTKPKAAEEDIQYSILAFKGNKGSPPPQPTLEASQPSDGMTIYSEIKKK